MRVAQTPDFLQSVANDPRVFPAIASKGRQPFDLSAVWSECIGLEFDTGGWVMHRQGDAYEAHTLFLPKSFDVRKKAAKALQFMFLRARAKAITGRIPADLPHARRLALGMGMQFVRREPDAIQRPTGPVALDHFQLTREAWATFVTETRNA